MISDKWLVVSERKEEVLRRKEEGISRKEEEGRGQEGRNLKQAIYKQAGNRKVCH